MHQIVVGHHFVSPSPPLSLRGIGPFPAPENPTLSTGSPVMNPNRMGGFSNNRFVLEPAVAIASEVSILSKSSIAITDFHAKKTQHVQLFENPLPGTPPFAIPNTLFPHQETSDKTWCEMVALKSVHVWLLLMTLDFEEAIQRLAGRSQNFPSCSPGLLQKWPDLSQRLTPLSGEASLENG